MYVLFVFGAGRVFSKLDESLWHYNTREIREFYFNVTYVCFINELMYQHTEASLNYPDFE